MSEKVCDQILILETLCWSLSLWLSMYETRKFVLFCYAEMRSSQTMVLHAVLSHIFKELLMSRGAMTWLETVWSNSVEKTIDY